MPIGPELLNPIPGDNPGGANLRYDPAYDKIKEARREDDAGPMGEWVHEIKKADWPTVIKLCSELLTKKTKDLQLVAWLTEALLRREGFSGLRDGLELFRGFLDLHWDYLYPEPEDGDLEERAVPLEWVGGRLGDSVSKVGITKSGLNLLDYKQARSIAYEEDASGNDAKREAREQAIADGKLTPEELDKAVEATSKDFYQNQLASIDACLESLEQLQGESEVKFGNVAPSFSGLRTALEDARLVVRVLWVKRGGGDEPQEEESAAEEESVEEAAEEVEEERPRAAAKPKAKKAAAPGGEPADRGDAYDRVAALAAWLRKDDPYNPVPYVLVRALRWTELRANGSDIDANLLTAPSTETRTEIKRLYNEGDYEQVLALVEAAAGEPCGRGWLDLQRYFANACDNSSGYEYAKDAVVSALKALLADYPDLAKMTLMDDTPTANRETQEWLESLLPKRQAAAAVEEEAPPPPPPTQVASATGAPDPFETAQQLAKRGKPDEAIALLAREVAMERCGRTHFLRQMQLAQICVSTNHEAVAFPILENLSAEIESRNLENWEQPELLAHVLSLFYRCSGKTNQDPEMRKKLYSRICRLDPVKALELK